VDAASLRDFGMQAIKGHSAGVGLGGRSCRALAGRLKRR